MEGWRVAGVCYREPSVYVSVNVMSSQDQGSRRAATMEGGGNGCVAERVLVGRRTFSCVDAGGFFTLHRVEGSQIT